MALPFIDKTILDKYCLFLSNYDCLSYFVRIGINSGPAVAGVIGKKKFSYDLWGDTVNLASRMESHGFPDHIQITESCYDLLKDKSPFIKREKIHIKGKGEMVTYLYKK